MKLNCEHADTCLSDYWGGHHLAHIQVAVWRDMTLGQLRAALCDELRQGAVAGNDEVARFLAADYVAPGNEKRADMITRAAYAAIARDVRMKPHAGRYPFRDLEESTNDDDGISVYAFFVFREADE